MCSTFCCQVAASLDRQRGGMMRQPDKRGATGGPANKKALNRMDSMGYQVRPPAKKQPDIWAWPVERIALIEIRSL